MFFSNRVVWAAVVVSMTVVGSRRARASSPAPCDAELQFLEQRVEIGARRSRSWALGWGLGLAALSVGQLAISPAIDAEERIDFYVGATAAAVGALTRAVFIPRVILHRRRLRREPLRGDTCARLATFEVEVEQDAAWERKGRGLLMHGLNLAFNAAVGVVLGVAFDRPVPGNRLAAIGAVVGEVMIITQPTYMSRSWDEYGTLFARRAAHWRTQPLVLEGGGGVTVAGRF